MAVIAAESIIESTKVRSSQGDSSDLLLNLDWTDDEIVLPVGDFNSDDEPQWESTLHLRQILLFLKCLEWLWKDRHDYVAAGNLTTYYSPTQSKAKDFRGPDFFVVLGAEPRPRKSWVVWEENGQYPHIIIELLSPSTARTDRGLKKELYQNVFRTPDYFWFDPVRLEFKGFHLVDGLYQDLVPDDRGLLWSQQLGLFLGICDRTLRFFQPDGTLVATPEEAAEVAIVEAEIAKQQAEEAKQQAEEATRQAEVERQQNEKLIAKLRELGVELD